MGNLGSTESNRLLGIRTYSRPTDFQRGDIIVYSNDGFQGLRQNMYKVSQAFPPGRAIDPARLPESGLVKGMEIGKGAFGVIYKGIFNGKKVGIKEFVATRNGVNLEDFLNEAKIMLGLNHKNVLGLIHIWTNLKSFAIVMQYMEKKDLSNYLGRSDVTVGNEEMRRFAIGIANGMHFLGRKNIIHRDLAARNILLNRACTVKIADFGLARFVRPDDPIYTSRGGIFAPRWTAPEGVLRRTFTLKSDVWSYGIVLIEIVTRGRTPYEGLSNDDVRAMLEDENQHTKPDNCSPELYNLMQHCWSFEPSCRPAFSTIAGLLENMNFEN